jgi:putative ABC transport system permease protein
MGVRLALGATPARLFASVVGRGLVLSGIGAGLGLAGSLAIGPSMRNILFGIEPTDPATLLAVPLLLALVALVACAIPGRRASQIEALEALRQ